MEKVKETISKYIGKDEKIAVGVSGGKDSMCLLHILLYSGYPKKENIVVVNIEHGIRGKESVADTEFVEKYCRENGVNFLCRKLDVKAAARKSGRSIETEARIQRKKIFDEILTNGIADKILLAHHADDQAETILMHIFRGSGLNGLKGMSVLSGGYLRPMLSVTRAEIETYVLSHNVPYVEDATNTDTEYNRNFIRRKILPLIRERWSGADNALIRLSDAAKKEDEFLSTLIDEDKIYRKAGAVCLKLDALDNVALAPRYIIKALKEFGLEIDFENSHITAVMGLKDALNGKSVCVVHGVKAIREYDCVAFCKEEERGDYDMEFSVGEFATPDGEIRIYDCECQPCRGKLRIDADKLPPDAVIRNRRDGDVFKSYGGGTKKLKDYMIDKKIPRRLRDFYPVVACGKRVYAILGVEISDDAKIDETTKRAFELEFRAYDED